jgi:hypothetical protein
VESSRKRRVVEMQTHEGKGECVGSFRTCSGSRRRLGRARAGAGKPAGCVVARAAAARCGEARRGLARGGEWRRGAGAARGAREGGAGAAGAWHMAGEGGRVGQRRKQRRRTGGGRRGA